MHGTLVRQLYRFLRNKSGFTWEMTSVPGISRPMNYLVLATTLFNLYTNNSPVTSCRKFIYADYICCAVQGQAFAELECTLSADTTHTAEYCRHWRLKPSTTKTITSVFHLHNTCASRAISLNGRAATQT